MSQFCSVSLESNLSNYSHTIRTKATNALNEMANDVVALSQAGTPKRTGNLRKNVSKDISSDLVRKVTWKQKYAAVQEAGQRNGKPFRYYTTPGTGPHFTKNAVKQIKQNAGRYF